MNIVKMILPRFILTFAMISMVSCSTMDINSAQPISVPSGLTTQEIKLAIVSAIYPERVPQNWTPTEQMTDNALKAIFGFRYSKVDRSDPWFVEEVRTSSVLVGYDDGDCYLRVEYVIDGNRIIQRIDGSRNLHQSGDTIRKAAFEYLGEMESRIRQSMGRLSVLKAESEKK